MLNFAILREPVNWLTIWSMLAIGVLLVRIVRQNPALTDFFTTDANS